VSLMACVLAGYAILMAVAQVRLIPVYRRLSFTPGAWTFVFSYAAAAAYAFEWLAIKKPPAATGYAIAAIALLTAFVSWIAFRTVVLAVRGSSFPPGHRFTRQWMRLPCREAMRLPARVPGRDSPFPPRGSWAPSLSAG
jgi:tellurite resistance protein TehA-like permease